MVNACCEEGTPRLAPLSCWGVFGEVPAGHKLQALQQIHVHTHGVPYVLALSCELWGQLLHFTEGVR